MQWSGHFQLCGNGFWWTGKILGEKQLFLKLERE
jgi:hypothetical protein